MNNPEVQRLEQEKQNDIVWKKWGPYLSERQWGTVREDYSQSGIFLRSPDGRRPVFGGTNKFQNDPNWRDYILFYEYFHADNGAGLGASHQTGWTGIVARIIQMFAELDGEALLKGGKCEVFKEPACI